MTQVAGPTVCAGCGGQIGPMLLACPGCGRLTFAERLQALADSARQAADRADTPAALTLWREALSLLPPDSRQFLAVRARIEQLQSAGPGAAPASPAPSNGSGGKAAAGAGLGGIALLLWKLKFAALVLLSHAKLLLLGLTKASTLFSMLLSLGVYWAAWGWKFALGLVLSIYVHEMGHVVALRRLGFKATAPLFIPGLGALIRLQQHPASPHEDAVIGLAGPIYGLAAAAVSFGLWALTRHPIFAAIAGVGAWINLFNLLPVWTLDGGRAIHAMSRPQRWIAAGAIAAAWFIARDGLLLLLLVVTAGRALSDKPTTSDRRATLKFVLLVLLLSVLATAKDGVPRSISHRRHSATRNQVHATYSPRLAGADARA